MSKDLSERVTNLEAWVEIVMRTLATLGLENLLIELDEARHAYDEESIATPKRGRVARGIRAAILRGDYADGFALSQDKLAAQYGVNRDVVWHALPALERVERYTSRLLVILGDDPNHPYSGSRARGQARELQESPD